MRRFFLCVSLLLFATTLTCFSQQTEIDQFAVFSAYSYLGTPSLNLTQRGFDGDLGYNVRSWLTFGFDFSRLDGHTSLQPNDLNTTTLTALAPFLGFLPPGGTPYSISTYTYEAGPQINYRRLKKFTFFVRPALGALHANVKATPPAPIAPMLCGLLGGCAKSDTVPFYGFGGGVTWEINPHFGLRVASDFAHYDFFSGLLNGGRSSVRLSVGTKFGFGKNIVK